MPVLCFHQSDLTLSFPQPLTFFQHQHCHHFGHELQSLHLMSIQRRKKKINKKIRIGMERGSQLGQILSELWRRILVFMHFLINILWKCMRWKYIKLEMKVCIWSIVHSLFHYTSRQRFSWYKIKFYIIIIFNFSASLLH